MVEYDHQRWPRKPKTTSVVRTKGVDVSVTSIKSG
jgi:hypothetical protein